MYDIYVDKKLSWTQVQTAVSKVFPDIVFYDWNRLAETDEDGPEGCIYIACMAEPERFEFAFQITLMCGWEELCKKRGAFLARQLSIILEIDTLITFQLPEDPRDPYYVIIFRNGQALLGDDCDTNFGDLTENRIRIIRPYTLKISEFDSFGQLLTQK